MNCNTCLLVISASVRFVRFISKASEDCRSPKLGGISPPLRAVSENTDSENQRTPIRETDRGADLAHTSNHKTYGFASSAFTFAWATVRRYFTYGALWMPLLLSRLTR